MTLTSSLGKTSRPRTMKSTTCATKARPWWKATTARREGARRVAEHQADDEDGEEAAALDDVGGAEGDRRRRERRDGREGFDGVREALEHRGCCRADHEARHEAEPELLDEGEGEADGAVIRLRQPFDESDRQRDRHRVVRPRLGLQDAGETAAQRGEAERREDGGGVGRADDGAEQERLRRREVEEEVREDAGGDGRDGDPQRPQ